MSCSTLLAADIGNSRIKLGRFERSVECESSALARPFPIAAPAIPEPRSVLELDLLQDGRGAREKLSVWLAESPLEDNVRWWLASVNSAAEDQLREMIEQYAGAEHVSWSVTSVVGTELPLPIHVEVPERVGVDRLLGALGANRLRRPDKPAIVVDIGTAITVDLVSPEGAFEGGAILPGIRMAARALHEQTALLPLAMIDQLNESPDAVGKSTEEAMRAGLYWGAVGAIREIIDRQRDRLVVAPQVFLTGGAAPSLATLIGTPEYTVRYVPHLILGAIAVAADQSDS